MQRKPQSNSQPLVTGMLSESQICLSFDACPKTSNTSTSVPPNSAYGRQFFCISNRLSELSTVTTKASILLHDCWVGVHLFWYLILDDCDYCCSIKSCQACSTKLFRAVWCQELGVSNACFLSCRVAVVWCMVMVWNLKLAPCSYLPCSVYVCVCYPQFLSSPPLHCCHAVWHRKTSFWNLSLPVLMHLNLI